MALVNDRRRFKVVPAGRRSGKTERAKRNIVKEAFRTPGGLFFCAAPTHAQAKAIYWKDLKALVPVWAREDRQPSETELTIYLDNGAEIRVVGLDKPARIEGQPWTGGVVDEIADVKPGAWEENIRPCFDTPGLENSWCWLIGVPDGLNHYYELAEYARVSGDPEWGLYHWQSADILKPEAIEAARRQLSPRAFRQEYEASFETATGRVYDDYSDANHSNRVFTPGPLLWAHDFNFLPLSSVIFQREGEKIFAVDEIVLEHAVARQAAEEFVGRYSHYKQCPVILYGDASGRVGEKHGHVSDYVEIEKVLKQHGFNVTRKVPLANPAIKDGQNSLRGKILNANGDRSLFVNPQKCPTLDKGLKTVQLQKGSTFQEDETNPSQHITTAARYLTAVEFPAYGQPTMRVHK